MPDVFVVPICLMDCFMARRPVLLRNGNRQCVLMQYLSGSFLSTLRKDSVEWPRRLSDVRTRAADEDGAWVPRKTFHLRRSAAALSLVEF
ncbi:hypothetical protein AVEN_105950-1 [Araneus ventricosus]|uniref:Uncharacterized protein n=1 Tax=Araneus ventricosus TaxID=182803 RepID=A0A4Y2DYI7_ARAVE|nr:hypothetical protein AVEN_105950-1 [Araneus ventricosus]